MRTAALQPPTLFASAACAVEVADAQGEPKTRFRLFPMGKIMARPGDGRGPWILQDLAHAQRVVDASLKAAAGTQLPIDYNHALVFAAPEGRDAPASGWIKALTAEPDGIYAEVEWTAAAAERLRAREYRYISPYFSYERGSGRVTRIDNAGLTNFPAITELAAVASAQPEEGDMDKTKLAEALGLGADATDAMIATALAAGRAAQTSLIAIAAAAGLTADAKPEAVVAAVTEARATAAAGGKPDPTKWAPLSLVEGLSADLATLKAAGAKSKAEAAVDAATASGKISPAMRDWALDLATTDFERFEKFIGVQPAIVNPDQRATASARAPADPNAELTGEERAAAAALGVSVEDFKKSKAAMGGA